MKIQKIRLISLPPPPPGDEGEGGEVETPGATGEEVDLAAFITTRFGKPLTPDEIEGLAQLSAWASSLTPQQSEAINRAFANPEAVLNPAPAPAVKDEPGEYEKLYEEYKDDPAIGPLYKALSEVEKRIEALTTTTTATVSENQQKQLMDGLVSGSEAFKTEFNLNDAELDALQGAVANSRVLPAFMQTTGNPAEAMKQALNHVYWTNPTFRNQAIDRQIQEQAEKETASKQRKTRATSVNGTGGNGASRTAAPARTPNDRWAAVAAGIGAAQNNGLPDNN